MSVHVMLVVITVVWKDKIGCDHLLHALFRKTLSFKQLRQNVMAQGRAQHQIYVIFRAITGVGK
jgi:hypothetical protein